MVQGRSRGGTPESTCAGRGGTEKLSLPHPSDCPHVTRRRGPQALLPLALAVALAALPGARGFAAPHAAALRARAGAFQAPGRGAFAPPLAPLGRPLQPPGAPSLTQGGRPVARGRGGAGPVMCGGELVAGGGLAMVLGTLEGIGLALPHAWFKMLGSPHPYFWAKVLFMASNISYFAAAGKILSHRAEDKRPLALLMCFVGLISSFFHGAQCAFGSGHPVTHAFCLFDTTTATLTGLCFFFGCGHHAFSLPSLPVIAGWLFAFGILSHTGPFYTLLHAFWHVTSAYLAYQMVEDHEAVRRKRPQPSLERVQGTVQLVSSVTMRRAPRGLWAAACAVQDGCASVAGRLGGALGGAKRRARAGLVRSSSLTEMR